jgi:O-methyltransferase
MISKLKSGAQRLINALGYKVERLGAPSPPHRLELDPSYAPIIERVKPFTMTSCERIASLIDAVRHISQSGVPGAIVECGVWRGGSMMAAALALLEAGDARDLYLFDTFAGMTAPTDLDVDHRGDTALASYSETLAGDHSDWCYASIEDVTANLRSTGYPTQRCHFIAGDVLQTIPTCAPEEIAILRLDTDWYESTRHELTQLFPRLQPGGILIVDDYGHWNGCRQAVDEYFGRERPFMFSIDYTGRAMVKHTDVGQQRSTGDEAIAAHAHRRTSKLGASPSAEARSPGETP